MSRLSKADRRERAEARQREHDKLSTEAKLAMAIRNGHSGTKEVKRLRAAIKAEREIVNAEIAAKTIKSAAKAEKAKGK